jgi:ferrous iron transport protein A
MNHLVSVTELRRGQVADVANVVGSPEQIRRLEELGLRRGVRVEIVRGGSPCIVRIGGTTLCFRHDDLASIIVSPRKSA